MRQIFLTSLFFWNVLHYMTNRLSVYAVSGFETAGGTLSPFAASSNVTTRSGMRGIQLPSPGAAVITSCPAGSSQRYETCG